MCPRAALPGGDFLEGWDRADATEYSAHHRPDVARYVVKAGRDLNPERTSCEPTFPWSDDPGLA
jgi:hypothetical protein